MWSLFQKKKTPSEILREHKRTLDKSIRELDRERTQMQNQEKKLTLEIKRTAKANQLGAVKVMAKDLVRTRHSITKFHALKSQLQGVSLRMQTLKSTQAMADAMRGVTKAMGQMNKKLNLPAVAQIMKEFEKQNEKMEMTTPVFSNKNQKMQFVVEESSNSIKPVDGSVAVKDRERFLVAVASFSGIANKEITDETEKKLREAMKREESINDGVEFLPRRGDEFVELAQYNDPFTNPLQRRNEVLIALENIRDDFIALV
mmetsp:Transcript_6964/g.23110  ORF Transcript_6964/g.23110 Transcript_6964/m.23110 type:complete len:259 (-) Transcript_6964:153-929(-)